MGPTARGRKARGLKGAANPKEMLNALECAVASQQINWELTSPLGVVVK